MKPTTIALFLASWAGASSAGAIAIGNDAPVDQDMGKEVVAAAPAAKEFKPPLGFIAKKRGTLVVYCSTITPIGTRFKTEQCYSEAQMRDYALVLKENKRDIDRLRSVRS